MKKIKITLAGALVVLACSPLVSAQSTPITVPNFSFELTTTGSMTGNDIATGGPTNVAGWTYDNASDAAGTQAFGTAGPTTNYDNLGNADGASFAFLNLTGSQIGTITSSSSLGFILPNTTYTLTVAVGNNQQADDTNFGSPGDTFLSLLGNGTAISTTFIPNGTVPNSSFVDETTTFTTGGSGGVVGQALTIQLAAEEDGGLLDQASFDNVRLTADTLETAVPEPSTWAMFVAGFVGLFWLTRRKLTT
jgi:PEP-CTERM motif